MFQANTDCFKVRDFYITDVEVNSVYCRQGRMDLVAPPASDITLPARRGALPYLLIARYRRPCANSESAFTRQVRKGYRGLGGIEFFTKLSETDDR